MAGTKSLARRSLRLLASAGLRAWDILTDGLRRLFNRPARPRCVVLYYHAVPVDMRARFARQMDELLRLARPITTHPDGPLDPAARHVAVTFDDGFVSVLDQALPELRRRGIPCTVFVPPGCLGEHPAWLRHAPAATKSERVVTADELRVLAADPLVTIGSHSLSHVNFLELEPEAAAAQFTRSKADLEAILGDAVKCFSFPFGAHNPALVRQALQSGYRQLFTSDPVPAFQHPNETQVGRIAVDPDDWPLEFRLKVLGAYRWIMVLQAGKRRLRNWLRPLPARAQAGCIGARV